MCDWRVDREQQLEILLARRLLADGHRTVLLTRRPLDHRPVRQTPTGAWTVSGSTRSTPSRPTSTTDAPTSSPTTGRPLTHHPPARRPNTTDAPTVSPTTHSPCDFTDYPLVICILLSYLSKQTRSQLVRLASWERAGSETKNNFQTEPSTTSCHFFLLADQLAGEQIAKNRSLGAR